MVLAQEALHARPEYYELRVKENEAREAYKIAHKNYTIFLAQKAR